jgi:inner membrane protein
MVAGAIAAGFPDGDFVMSLGSSIGYVLHHRGITHSVLMLPLWAVLLGWLMAFATKKPSTWRYYALICGLGVGIHILGDVITSFGTMLLAPLSDARFELGTTFIIDLLLTAILLAGLLVSVLWRASRIPAVAALVAVCGYVALEAWLREQAVAVGARYAQAEGLSGAVIDALPRPPLPTNWTIVVRHGEEYRYAHVNLWRTTLPAPAQEAGFFARLHAAFLPPDYAAWERKSRFGGVEPDRTLAREAWNQPDFAFYRWFAAFPALSLIHRGNPTTCVFFEDLRFLTPGRLTYPFRYGLCRDDAKPWALFKLTGQDTPESLR